LEMSEKKILVPSKLRKISKPSSFVFQNNWVPFKTDMNEF
jgi:hypothetical protein